MEKNKNQDDNPLRWLDLFHNCLLSYPLAALHQTMLYASTTINIHLNGGKKVKYDPTLN